MSWSSRPRESTTQSLGPEERSGSRPAPPPLGLTIVLHPEGRRVGEHRPVPELERGLPVALSRREPLFSGEGTDASLEYVALSRRPLWLRRHGGALEVHPSDPGVKVRVQGEVLHGRTRLPWELLEREGLGLELGGCVTLWLHRTPGLLRVDALPEWVGASLASHLVLTELELLADRDQPVLLRGESGVGKELAALALHRLSRRHAGPWVTVNAGALSPADALAALFGEVLPDGSERPGAFARAEHGTLLLDEIGELSPAVQPMLLRALDHGEIQPVGGVPRVVSTRVVMATDADLEERVAAGTFRNALLQRISGLTVVIPPLRQRPVDAALIFQHALRHHLRELGAEGRLVGMPEEAPWNQPRLLRQVLEGRLEGNARELWALAARVAAHSHALPHAELPEPEPEPSRPGPPRRAPLTPASVRAALRNAEGVLSTAAHQLGVSRATLVAYMRTHAEFVVPSDLGREPIEAALLREGSVEGAARALGVSVRGLQLRMARLGLVCP